LPSRRQSLPISRSESHHTKLFEGNHAVTNAFCGSLTKKIMPDFLHLSEQGYNIWGEAVEETVQMLLEGKKN